LDGEKSERAKALYASGAGYVGSLTRIRREIGTNSREEPTVLPANTYSLPWTLTHPVLSYQQPSYNPQIWDTTWNPYMCNVGLPPLNSNHGTQVSGKIDTNIEIVKALKQVVATPKIEYMHFDGNPIKFPSFMHNFETCLERNSDESTLQLLIQHCHGKAKEAIETCVNLPADEGYCVTKKTLTENFGKPHIIARAHIKKLVNLPSIKKADGPSLLEFARHLESTNRTLKGMGPEYVSDLDHVNTLKELNRKLPMFMKARWTEKAGKIYEGNSTPRFEDFLNFIKKKATLMNNEFGDDLISSDSKDRSKEKWRNNEKGGRFNKENIALMVGMKRDENGKLNSRVSRRNCSMCSGLHGIWQCEKFRLLSLTERKKVVTQKSLCFKCLAVGHYARMCLKKHF
jgi:hypothetical protein